ncbi:hypothetical protein DFH29DRAFT_778355, partial [Suillus ampliporus]
NVMRDNILINVSGHDGHAVGVDKNCEQNINFQKNWFAAKGVHGTWDQLGDLAPNISIYCPLRRQFAKAMGNSWSGTTHTSPNSSKSIKKVMSKAMEQNLHVHMPGCT